MKYFANKITVDALSQPNTIENVYLDVAGYAILFDYDGISYTLHVECLLAQPVPLYVSFTYPSGKETPRYQSVLGKVNALKERIYQSIENHEWLKILTAFV
ncbi:hypothetical protein [Cohnella mopanensis]|uniref:hypothetical protein n=1 Tax=Cohnella mopanensis TaxID=2911966 RepID=UPI001EF99A1B|nr:hypothetical protein [Cohnella mopanensis]